MSFSGAKAGFRTPDKPPRSLSDQVALLRGRGLVIGDDDEVAQFLRTENYYRFSGYAREFQRDPRGGDNQFIEGTTFEQVMAAMAADELLSRRLLPALLRIERAIRGNLAYELAMHHGSKAFYLRSGAYVPGLDRSEELGATIERRLQKSKHRGVQRYVNGGDCSLVPIWVAIEDLTFGAVSQLVTHLADRTAVDRVADYMGFKRREFASVVASFCYLRNACAHHAQLWNRYNDAPAPLVIKKAHKRHHPEWGENSMYPTIIAMDRLLAQCVDRSDPCQEPFGRAKAYLQDGASSHVVGFLRPQPQ